MSTPFSIIHEGRRIEVVPESLWTADRVRPPDPAPLRLEPAAGSCAAREHRFERDHPGLYAARHVAKGVGQALLAGIGLTLALSVLPGIPLPHVELPEIDLPSLPLPRPDLPDLDLPGWLRAVLEAKKYWLPVLIGIALAVREWRRRHRPPANRALQT